jgi:hypothetical protein
MKHSDGDGRKGRGRNMESEEGAGTGALLPGNCTMQLSDLLA